MFAVASHRVLACRIVSALACVFIAGCFQCPRRCVPVGLLRPESTVDLNSTADVDQAAQHNAYAAALARLKANVGAGQVEPEKKYDVLALSGGGSYGAYSAGVLNGWTASGTRPTFDIVSGVSTGALIATYAFLGPEYDDALRTFYTTTTQADIYRSRFKPAVLWSESFASSEPLKQLIDSQISPRILCSVAAAHAEGRRLYIGTTNLDTGRLVIWDMGAIASSGRADALQLYRSIVLASASVPGFLPPVDIDVTVNGRCYTEKHVDGGTTAQVFFRASMLQFDQSQATSHTAPLAGSRVYIIVAGKYFPDPKCVNDRAVKIAGSAIGTLTYAQTLNDLIRVYTLTLLTGMDFRVTAIPQEMRIGGDSLAFDQAEMRRLYDCGYQLALAEQVWSDKPPVLDGSQQSIPRAGVNFAVPQPLEGRRLSTDRR